jgi:hypothetical protein
MPQKNKKIRYKDKDTGPQEILEPTYDQVVDALLKNACIVFFTKKTDGMPRQMKCTLDQKFMLGKYRDSRLLRTAINIWKSNSGVEVNRTVGKKRKYKTRTFKEGLLPVWDMEKQNWRSFYIENIRMMIIDNNRELS